MHQQRACNVTFLARLASAELVVFAISNHFVGPELREAAIPIRCTQENVYCD